MDLACTIGRLTRRMFTWSDLTNWCLCLAIEQIRDNLNGHEVLPNREGFAKSISRRAKTCEPCNHLYFWKQVKTLRMKRMAAFAALLALSVAWSIRAKAQSSGLADYERQSRKTYKKHQKEANREAKRQAKKMRKAGKKQRKAMKKYLKEQRRQAKR